MPNFNDQSILTSVKSKLGLAEDYTAFDSEVLDFTNSALSSLNQIGVGPVTGFRIEGKDETWGNLLGGDEPRLDMVRDYVFLKVRMIFDPPGTSFHIAAIEKQIEELGWRIAAFRDEQVWLVDKALNENPNEPLILDGGGA